MPPHRPHLDDLEHRPDLGMVLHSMTLPASFYVSEDQINDLEAQEGDGDLAKTSSPIKESIYWKHLTD